jgi:peptidoglycan/LPS O-acetylase OafA/YrhL
MEMKDYFEPGVIAKNLVYLPGQGFITPLWSLTYEVMFYLLAPFLLRRVNIYVYTSLLLFLVNLIFPSAIDGLYLPRRLYDFLFVYNIYFAVGVFLYANFEKILGWFTAYTKFEFILIVGGLLLFMYGANIYFQIETAFTFIEAAMLSCALIIFFLKYEIRIPPLMKIGQFSYSLYISHFPSIFLYLAIYWAIVHPTTPYILNFFVWMPAVLFVVAIAWVHYQLIEKKTKKILNLLRRQKPVILTN